MLRILPNLKTVFSVALLFSFFAGTAQENYNQNKFRQLYQELPTPNSYRTASGAPGHEYYQQQADYKMDIRLDDEKQVIYGKERITYTNFSPDTLKYLWVQLDQNVRAKDSDTKKISYGDLSNTYSLYSLKRDEIDFDGGFKLDRVEDTAGVPLMANINKTMMRIDMVKPLAPGSSFSFNIDWWYNINERAKIGGRSGFEYFKKDDNYLYTIAQFFPRMAVYNEVEGWQNKQFLGRGEFTLPFGNYEVNLTVPADHVVASTGTLQNPKEVLSAAQMKRLEEAKKSFKDPVMIVTQDEAIANESSEKSKGTKTWKYKAENVRDFGFASSRKFIWDAMAVQLESKVSMAMSAYPKEGNPLWETYSTRAVAQTLITYSRHTIEYPYPVAWSIHSASIGMEYPMICFNGGRPNPDGTFSDRTRRGMISVIIHEVGHNFFPMIINSDERQWTWMDEGLNTFCQYLTEQEFEEDYKSRRGPPYKIIDYMKGEKNFISPIMTNSESIFQFGNNAYGKPATALNILRESVMGRELFDYAFREYAQRWAFKHPSPADFFRSMEDASSFDLDWFWRGWFFTNDHVDLSINEVNVLTGEDLKNKFKKVPDAFKDFINDETYYYEMTFENIGGLVMPIFLEFEFEDGSKVEQRIPAEIWRMTGDKVSKVFTFEKKAVSISLDPKFETADVDVENNYWPKKMVKSKFQEFEELRTKK
ncbi:M1 family metallopeptidase [Salibacteraceae bacterium]|nr:M1 family metallopeptidase [Salibacteraceae bacterium]